MGDNALPHLYPLMTQEERLAKLRALQGIWDHYPIDPLQELENIRQEWEHDVPEQP
jgi:hypothetical protein